MKELIAKIVAFTLLQMLVFRLVFWVPDELLGSNLYVSNIKHAQAQKSQSPRLILVGGSNLAYGIEQETLEKASGRDVVNMGLSVSFGLPYLLREGAHYATSGDVIVLAPEWELLGSDVVHDEGLARLIGHRPANLAFFSREEWQLALDGAIKSLALRSRSGLFWNLGWDIPTRRVHPDQYGAFLVDDERPSPPRFRSQGLWYKPYDEEVFQLQIARLKEFQAKMKEKGVDLLLHHTPLPQEVLAQEESRLREMERRLTEELGQSYLEDLSTSGWPWERMYDSSYHLRRSSAIERSAALGKAIKARLSSAPKGR